MSTCQCIDNFIRVNAFIIIPLSMSMHWQLHFVNVNMFMHWQLHFVNVNVSMHWQFHFVNVNVSMHWQFYFVNVNALTIIHVKEFIIIIDIFFFCQWHWQFSTWLPNYSFQMEMHPQGTIYSVYSSWPKNPRAHNSGTIVVMTIKREIDMWLNLGKPHGKFQVHIWDGVENNRPMDHIAHLSNTGSYENTFWI
jgi:hypothetical protein